MKEIALGSGLLDFTGLDRLNRDPHPFDLPIREKYTDSLHIRFERSLGNFSDVGTDAPAFFGKTFSVNSASADGSLSGD
jgi:hypothetical protein